MREFTMVTFRIWHNEIFQKCSDAEKVLYLYIYFGPHINMTGCCYLPPGYAIYDLRWDELAFQQALAGLVRATLIAHDGETSEVFVVGYEKDLPLGPNHKKGLLDLAKHIRSDALKRQVIETAESRDPYRRPRHS